MTIEAPEYEVVEITGTIKFVGGNEVTFTISADEDSAQGDQPWIGKSTDIRTLINEALGDNQFWFDGLVTCPNCGERVEESEMNHWPNLAEPISMCDSCEHDARRSGWEPGR